MKKSVNGYKPLFYKHFSPLKGEMISFLSDTGDKPQQCFWLNSDKNMEIIRGLAEEAPCDSLQMSNIDKTIDSDKWSNDHPMISPISEQSKKTNNRLLFLTVEYVEDHPRLLPTYETVSFPSRAPSPLSDFEHRVSPLDPNMSSTARYSPTPVQLPQSPFQNSVLVLQGSPSPLISPNESNIRTNINYVTQLAQPVDTPNLPRPETTTEFVDDNQEEALVSSVGGELILMQGIPGTDFNLTRDFLVMQDDQLNSINSLKSQTLEIQENRENFLRTQETDSVGLDNKLQDIEMIFPNDVDESKDSKEEKLRRSKRHIEDNEALWCEECDNTHTNMEDYAYHNVCTIADQPVPSRAIATLPGSHLSINKLSEVDATSGGLDYGVFAKRNIKKCTRFGPIEGILCPSDGTTFENTLPLLYETEDGKFLKVDVSDENASNWMRFVRPALSLEEQNMIICQQKDGIVFLTCRDISVKEELKAGVSPNYAMRRNLIVLKSHEQENRNQLMHTNKHSYNHNRKLKIYHGRNLKENSGQNLKEWVCSTCYLGFPKASLLDIHTVLHAPGDVKAENNLGACPQCKSEFPKLKDLANHVSQHAKSSSSKLEKPSLIGYKCSMCYKRFTTKVRLQQHCLVHGANDQKPLPCNICLKRFMNNSALSCHLKTHKENKQTLECPICNKCFEQTSLLKDHVETHKDEDNTFNCPYCQRVFTKYSIIRKHIKAHHCGRQHTCQFCAKTFPTVDKLKMHLLKHSDHKEFQCANCGKQFKRKDKLKEHMNRIHNNSSKLDHRPAMDDNNPKKFVPKVNPNDYNRFVYKCHQCLVGFKRRGMLVNHLAKRHPDVSPESVPELNLPILRQTRDYYCQYCEKVYKSSSKRKAHIMKNHPGAALPPSNRRKESDHSCLPNPTFSQTVGSVTTTPQSCQWCHKQYASKAKLLQHQRKKHPNLMEPADQIPRSRNRPPQNQNQPPASIDDFIACDYIQSCETNPAFHKEKMKILNDVDPVNGGLDIVGQQVVRMRDIR